MPQVMKRTAPDDDDHQDPRRIRSRSTPYADDRDHRTEQDHTGVEEYRDDDQDVSSLDEDLGDGALPTIAPPGDWVMPRSERERLWNEERTLFPNLSGVPDEPSDDDESDI